VIHRDIKPGNLIVGRKDDRLYITDFGLARLQTAPSLTRIGVLMATPRYASPEQALAKRVPVDHRTDIYSLGVTLYELLTLELAFDGSTQAEVLWQITFKKPCPPRQIAKAIPIDLETIILKAIARVPDDRYATARQMADDLECFLDGRPILAKRLNPLKRVVRWVQRNKILAVVMVLALVIAVNLLIYFGSGPSGTVLWPKDDDHVPESFIAQGVFSGNFEGRHVWLMIRFNGECEMVGAELPTSVRQWSSAIIKPHDGPFDLVLISVGQEGQKCIDDWFATGKEKGHWPDICPIPGAIPLHTVHRLKAR
jgi:serine/threonine protein kinase